MRHGLDPDHIAIINATNFNNHTQGKSNSWSGFFFSLGHGVTVTLIGVLIITLNESLKSFTLLLQLTEWVPIFLLLFTGFYGLYNILNKKEQHSHKRFSSFLSNSKYPSLKLFLTGLVFALIFDTSTQVAAWGLVGQKSLSYNAYAVTVLIGLSFTIGMILTDTLSGIVFYQVLNTNNSKFNLKTFLSLIVIFTSLMLGIIQLLEKIGVTIDIKDHFKLIWGALMLVITIIVLLVSLLINHNNKAVKYEPK